MRPAPENTSDSQPGELRPLLAALAISAARQPTRRAVADDQVDLTYEEFLDRIGAAAARLREGGIAAGDRVVLSGPNGTEMAIAYFAVHAAGAIAVPVDPTCNRAAFDTIASDARPAAVIAGAGALSNAALTARWRLADLVTPGTTSTDVTIPRLDSVADILFTTGTTGGPKGVVLTHANIAHAARNISTFLGQTAEDLELVPVPLTHSFGLGRLRCLAATGNAILFQDGLKSPAQLVDKLVARRATGLALVPAGFALLRKLTKGMLRSAAETIRYVEIGSAAMVPQVREWLLEMLPHTRICHHYGLTEASRAAFVELSSEDARLGSIGRASPNVEVVIVDEQGNALPDGAVGELCIRGGIVMREYLNRPDLTAAALSQGTLRSGDLAVRDSAGRLFLHGRLVDQINVGGLKVAPDEVEAHLREHPTIADAACIGVPDPDELVGERIKAFLVLRDGDSAAPAPRELGRWLRERGLESHKLPFIVEIVATIPRSAAGKILRRELRTGERRGA